ncbi:MAG: hypothetical protein JXB48_07710 [Candidatus Latescibacteria bacterium]|nr:hypothetical protein [Candidatus Latescibacterota bacterium]
MTVIFKYLTIFKYEVKILLRNNTLKAFILISIPIAAFYNFLSFHRYLYTLHLYISYLNTTYMILFQGIVYAVIVTDVIKDLEYDSNVPIHTRSIANAGYYFAKILSVIIIMLIINAFILFLVYMSCYLINDEIPYGFFFYTAIISIPTLVFITGMTSICMLIIRNRPLCITLIMGVLYSMHHIDNQLYNFFDFAALSIPLTPTDFVSMPNLEQILLQRGMYLFMGLGLLLLSVLSFRRLSQSVKSNEYCKISGVFLIGLSFICGYLYLSENFSDEKFRQEMITINNEYIDQPVVSITDCELDIRHNHSTIAVKSNITLKNQNLCDVDSYVFSLNPGLKIKKINQHNKEVDYIRKQQILVVEPEISLKSDGIDSLTIFYEGTINNSSCYFNTDQSVRSEINIFNRLNIYKSYCFLSPEYVLLIPDVLWYPYAGIYQNGSYNQKLANFRLKVETDKDFTVISQGKSTVSKDGTYYFTPEYPLPQLSLIIGKYEKKSIMVDDIEYSTYVLPGHDFFSIHFDKLSDRISDVIRLLKQENENKIGLSYPYRRISCIEVPIQFYCFDDQVSNYQNTVQPEQVFIHEYGMYCSSTYFEYYKEKLHKEKNIIRTDEEIQEEMFSEFIQSNFFNLNELRIQFADKLNQKYVPNYQILPNYYRFVNRIYSANFPYIDTVFENYFNNKIEHILDGLQYPVWKIDVCRTMKNKSLHDIQSDCADKKFLKHVFKMKSDYLFSLIYADTGKQEFESYFNKLIQQSRFSIVDFDSLRQDVIQNFNLDLYSLLNNWYYKNELPGFIISDVTISELTEGNREKYFVSFNVTNTGQVEGLLDIKISFHWPDVEKRLYKIEGLTEKEIGLIFYSKPFPQITFNTIISQNIPTIFNIPMIKNDIKNDSEVFDGEKIVRHVQSQIRQDEIIVDNEDASFIIHPNPNIGMLTNLFKKKIPDIETKLTFSLGRPPPNWTIIINQDFYGLYNKSVHIIKSGKGSQKVEWNAQLPESAEYDIYYFTPVKQPFFRSLINRHDFQDLNFVIPHEDGVAESTIDVQQSQNEWTLIGSYYFSKGTSNVMLTDKSQGKIIYADAVKWVKR